ncbi:hypothetical protein AB0469_33860 [Streptomyces sp. NPDC093801]|uniref:hypothetical protein n=1 Tax=Streptomyces sp. NPDC093801 TaxID=3155203 RepID=UPI00344EDDC8
MPPGVRRAPDRARPPRASPAGRRLLVALDRERAAADPSRRQRPLTAVAVRGLGAVRRPGLRAALAARPA